MSPEQRNKLLREEYFFIQQQYQGFDDKTLTIKGWISTGAIAGLALAFGRDTQHAKWIPWFIIVICGVFWYLEAYWKLFQYAFRDRIRIIEAHFRDDQSIIFHNPDPLQVYEWWFLSYLYDMPIYEYEKSKRPVPRWKRLLGAASQRSVLLPYFVIILICFVSAWVLRDP